MPSSVKERLSVSLASHVPKDQPEPPFIGALLRLARESVGTRLLKGLETAGFGDINAAYFTVLQYPGPDGATPSELAERAGMTKQAMNYTLGQLEELGYIKRKSEAGRRQTTVRLTPRGWRAIEAVWQISIEIETELREMIGKAHFEDFRSVLKRLAGV
jgi:DNA-binding MarR family transcriptional regulator